MQDGFQLPKPFRFLLSQLSHRDLCPSGDHIGDLSLSDHQLSGCLFLLPFFADLFDLFAFFLLAFFDLTGLLICLCLNRLLLLVLQLFNLFCQTLDLCRLLVGSQADL